MLVDVGFILEKFDLAGTDLELAGEKLERMLTYLMLIYLEKLIIGCGIK